MNIIASSNGLKARFAGTALMALAVTIPAAARSAPALLQESQSVTIDAPAGTVWGVTGRFADLTWVPAVKSSSATDGNTPGSHRTLDFGGAQMTETLRKYSASKRSYTYAIDNTETNHKLAPVTDVVARISVAAEPDGTSVLTWSATFHRLDHGASPAAGADDAAAQKQINAVFAMGLAGAKAKVEGEK
jgi:mxaD protein